MFADDLSGPDPADDGRDRPASDDGRAIGDVLRAHADGYSVDVDALLVRLSAECGPLRPEPSSPPTTVLRRVAVVPDPTLAVRRRARVQTALAAAACVAVIVGGSTAVRLVGGDQGAPGPAGVAGQGGTTPQERPTLGVPVPPPPTGGTRGGTRSVPALPPATSVSSTPSAQASSGGSRLPSTSSWSASGPVIAPRSDVTGRTVGIKDPSVVYHDGRWHVFATAVAPPALGLVHLSFTDWSRAAAAPQDHLELSPLGPGYRAAPHVFWFAPQKLWYLVYQTDGNASYSTNPDIDDPLGWSAPKNFYPSTPRTVSDRLGRGTWVDMWVVCDSTTCHLFSTDTNGRLYRSQTRLGDFPRGMGEPVVALEEPTGNDLLDGAAVYRLAGGGGYLLLAEAIDGAGHRYTRSWLAPTPAGPWTPRRSPFATAGTVAFAGSPWTQDVAQGELLRAGADQTMTIDPCGLRYLVSGHRPVADGAPVPWRIGLLSQAGPSC
ncbi:non-reducing end alpha-L-arabinofuranosidase family hydrolase [Kineosporia sp. R_H_3]|uniref:non-reducing end alpha-L-arabinofuranosidase family hydrolase n=1 Tax=Kineosporia sp. R_H_3 TaxID=1961848 RepID=UPI000B4AFFCD|nr:non-reducing end alpha-L-arabinofuranosidase family hydrolase [Kineosporia sp. R_H_3]